MLESPLNERPVNINIKFRSFIKKQHGEAIHVVEKHRLERELKVLWRDVLFAMNVAKKELPYELVCSLCDCTVGESDGCGKSGFCWCHNKR
jgi:hypothetical protein